MNFREINTGNRDASFGQMRNARLHHAISVPQGVTKLYAEEFREEARREAASLSRLGQRRSVRHIEEGTVYQLFGKDQQRTHGVDDGYHNET